MQGFCRQKTKKLFTQISSDNKKEVIRPLFYGVDEVTILEPFDNEILSQIIRLDNIYHKLILFMQLDTQTYYNIRMVLGLETCLCNRFFSNH